MEDEVPVSPPRLVIARHSRLSSDELQRQLTPPKYPNEQGGALWRYGQEQKAKTFETDHFRVLYAKRRLRSPLFILLFAAATVAAIYLALDARWTGQKQLPLRFQSILTLSSFTFAISAVLTLILAQLSVTLVMSISTLVALAAIVAEYFVLSRTLGSSLTTNTIVGVTILIAYVILSLIHISVSSAMRVVRLGSVMLRMNPIVLLGGYLSHLIIWTAIYALAPLVLKGDLWPIFYLFWLNSTLESILSFLAAGIAARSMYEPITTSDNWHAWNQLKTLPFCLGSILRVSLFVSALSFLRFISDQLKALCMKAIGLLQQQQEAFSMPVWLIAKVTLWPMVSLTNLFASGIQTIVTMLLQYFGSQVIIQIGVYGGSVTAAVRRVASKSSYEHFNSGALYLSLWLLRILVIIAAIAAVAVLQNLGVLTWVIFGNASKMEIWSLSALMAVTTAGDMSALLSAASEALVTVTGRDSEWLEKRYKVSKSVNLQRVDEIDDSDVDTRADLLQRVINFLRDSKKAELNMFSDEEEEWESEEDVVKQLKFNNDDDVQIISVRHAARNVT